MLSELAAHPTMKSGHLMRPHKDGDLEAGPFVEPEFLEAVLCEMARVAVQAGEVLDRFLPETWVGVLPARAAFRHSNRTGQWGPVDMEILPACQSSATSEAETPTASVADSSLLSSHALTTAYPREYPARRGHSGLSLRPNIQAA